jgi:hypothetical protein
MTTRNDFNVVISDWLDDQAGRGAPAYLDEILARTTRTRQRPAWSSLERWLPMDLTARARTFPLPAIGRIVLVGLLLITLLGLALAFAGSRQRLPAPFGPAANGGILSSTVGDIFLASSDGTGRRPLIAGSTNDFGPAHSHDGTRFVFWREVTPETSLVMVANADGTGVRPLLATPLNAADWYEWSPADDRLAIVHGVDGRHVLSILDVATGALRQLDVPGLNVDSDVLWRPPNGDELIFTARADLGSATGAALYAIRPDGSDLRTIVGPWPLDWSFLNLEISPDGRSLTYWMYEVVSGEVPLRGRVHVVDVATEVDRLMRFDPAAVDESELHFSPDGRTGLIVTAGAQANAQASVEIVDLVGAAPARLVGPAFAGDEGKAIGFSPDGTTIVLAFDNDRPNLIDVATGKVVTGPDVLERWDSWQRLAP